MSTAVLTAICLMLSTFNPSSSCSSLGCRFVLSRYAHNVSYASAPIRMRNVYQMPNEWMSEREWESVCVWGARDRAKEQMGALSLSIVEHVLQVNDYDKNFEVLNVCDGNLFPYCKGSLSLWSIFYVCESICLLVLAFCWFVVVVAVVIIVVICAYCIIHMRLFWNQTSYAVTQMRFCISNHHHFQSPIYTMNLVERNNFWSSWIECTVANRF